MKLVWCPDTASKAYIDTVKSCEPYEDTGVAEMVSAMAGGWNPELIVETWSRGGAIATSIGLAQASRHTGGRHVCIVEDEESRSEYVNAFHRILSSLEASHRHRGHQLPEIMVGEAEEVMSRLDGVDFLVVDRRHKEKSGKVLGLARLSHRGAVLVCKNAVIGSSSSNLGSVGWRRLVGVGARVVRSVYVPVGKGLEIAYIGGFELGGNINSNRSKSRWVTHIDCVSGEEHVFRK